VVARLKPDSCTRRPDQARRWAGRPYQNCTFTIKELEGFRVEFQRDEAGVVDTIIFHQPNGTFLARRISV
jgi:hypothetical protein